ncbi:hypothetical protein N7492_001893 [Penicillium capsulatum]|uniref:Ketoreductase domain-containing protein n=1 Tax=Penicillium capsulatum TaxID=69766 RepID=A0A9W9IUG2_9EURO|nr:hypothetical protein N7492_001893 [Penicillium capsulatum]KAJ6129059.1 hypothetical protein N7512_001839 [Penicillium capsulatum]
MAATTFCAFDANTEGLAVAEAFAAGIHAKTVMVTGVNKGGIGYATARAFASQAPAHLIITGRNLDKIQDAADTLRHEFPRLDCRLLRVDLSVQQSVRDAAAEVLGWTDVPKIDILINSAGVMGIPERTLTAEGIEMHFATNHLGHWLLTCLLMPKLIHAAAQSPRGATRVVNVSSASPRASVMRWSDLNFEMKNRDLPVQEQPSYPRLAAWGYIDPENTTYNALDGYDRSKVANVLSGIGANRRLFEQHGILSLAVHPGIISTELGRNFPVDQLDAVGAMREKGIFTLKTMGAGASTSMVAALDPKLAHGVGMTKDGRENWGSYLSDCHIDGQAKPLAVSSQEAERLWKRSETLVGQVFTW